MAGWAVGRALGGQRAQQHMQCVAHGGVWASPLGVRSMKGMFTAEGAWPEENSSGVLHTARTAQREGGKGAGRGRKQVDEVCVGAGEGERELRAW